jgi:hypothetical protein
MLKSLSQQYKKKSNNQKYTKLMLCTHKFNLKTRIKECNIGKPCSVIQIEYQNV